MDAIGFWMAKSVAELLFALLIVILSIAIFAAYSITQVYRKRERMRREDKHCPKHYWTFLNAYGSQRRCTKCGVWRNYEDR